MYFAIDAREALRKKRSGKGVWTKGFIEELQKRNTNMALLHSSQCSIIQKLLRLKPDFYISPTSFIIPALIGRWVPSIIVVHDLIAFQKERHAFKAKWIERLTLGSALKHAVHICTVSASTKQDILQRFPYIPDKKITVIFAGPSVVRIHPKQKRECQLIVCIGTLCPRKNQLHLIEAFSRIAPRHNIKLILAGSRGWDDEEIIQKVRETSGVSWLDHISDQKYLELLEEATIFALPSHYEGFGLSILDAMKVGVPVLTSRRGSLKEVAGDAALYVNPESIDSIAQGLMLLLENENIRHDCIEKGQYQAKKFSWKKTVDLFLEFIT